MKIVVVGFKVKEENSVFYKKFEIRDPDNGHILPLDRDKIGTVMAQALTVSDFVSVRRIDANSKRD